MLAPRITLIDPLPSTLTPLLRYACSLLATPKRLTPFRIKHIQPLLQKHGGGGYRSDSWTLGGTRPKLPVPDTNLRDTRVPRLPALHSCARKHKNLILQVLCLSLLRTLAPVSLLFATHTKTPGMAPHVTLGIFRLSTFDCGPSAPAATVVPRQQGQSKKLSYGFSGWPKTGPAVSRLPWALRVASEREMRDTQRRELPLPDLSSVMAHRELIGRAADPTGSGDRERQRAAGSGNSSKPQGVS